MPGKPDRSLDDHAERLGAPSHYSRRIPGRQVGRSDRATGRTNWPVDAGPASARPAERHVTAVAARTGEDNGATSRKEGPDCRVREVDELRTDRTGAQRVPEDARNHNGRSLGPGGLLLFQRSHPHLLKIRPCGLSPALPLSSERATMGITEVTK